MALRSKPPRWTLHADDGSVAKTDAANSLPTSTLHSPEPTQAEDSLVVLVRTLEQLEQALAADTRILYCDFEDPKRYRDAVQRVRSGGAPSTRVFVAPPRVFKPGEEWILKLVRSAEPDGFLVRNYDHLAWFKDAERIGDFSLNVANALSAEHFMERHGLRRVTASYDLNAGQLEAVLRSVPSGWIEITIHQHMPMFHMEHCVFCAFLSKGKDYRDCGRPCDRHDVRLRDRVGARHPIRADAGCRNTVFNARAQTGAEHVAKFQAAGARHFRIEFLDEPAGDVIPLIQRYRDLLRGRVSPEALWKEFRLLHQLGVTRGQMNRATGSDIGENRWAAR
jgi:putative protease